MSAYRVYLSLIKEIPTNLYRYLVRKRRRFNVVPRMEKKIDKLVQGEITERAPIPTAQKKLLEEMTYRDPDAIEKYSEKDEKLNANLRNVYVKSIGDNKDSFKKYMVKVKPMDHALLTAPKTEVEENIPIGRYTLEEATEYLVAHSSKPNEFSIEAISHLFSVPPEKMKNILTHVKVFKCAKKEAKVPNSFAQTFRDGIEPMIAVTEEAREEAIVRIQKTFDRQDLIREEVFKVPRNRNVLFYDKGFQTMVNPSPEMKKELEYTGYRGPLRWFIERAAERQPQYEPSDFKFDAYKAADMILVLEEAKKRKALEAEAETRKKIEASRLMIGDGEKGEEDAAAGKVDETMAKIEEKIEAEEPAATAADELKKEKKQN